MAHLALPVGKAVLTRELEYSLLAGLPQDAPVEIPSRIAYKEVPRWASREAARGSTSSPAAHTRAFDQGLGGRLALGLDWSFNVGYLGFTADAEWRPHQGDANLLAPCTFMPPPPFVYLFQYTIPRFKEMGVTDEMLHVMLVDVPQRLVPVRKP